jgi:hypothetical protein
VLRSGVAGTTACGDRGGSLAWQSAGNNLLIYHPCHPCPFGILGLAGFCHLISGLQSVMGKILSRNELLGWDGIPGRTLFAVFEVALCLLKSSGIAAVDGKVRCHGLCANAEAR